MNIVILDGYTLNPGDNPWTDIEALGTCTFYDRTPAEKVVERSLDADVILTNKVRITAEIIKALPRLKCICVTATGYDVVDIDEASTRSIPVCNVPGYSTDSVAQHVMALMLGMSRRVELHSTSVHQGKWTSCPDWCFWETDQIELTGKTMGIVGFGNIGRKVGELAHAFGMRIMAYSPRPKPSPEWNRFTFAELDELFASSDFISLHCPLTPETKHLVNSQRLTTMRKGAMIINTARGPLIDEAALARSLKDGHLGGAALDVVSVEPISPDNPLLNAPNCIITPHIAWASSKARATLTSETANNIKAWQNGTPCNVVNKPSMENSCKNCDEDFPCA